MEHSPTYQQWALMIEKDWTPSVSDFNKQLDALEQEELITAEEHRSLIELYIQKFKTHR
jgi:hypothetical protein